MRIKLINFLKQHSTIVQIAYVTVRYLMKFFSLFIPIQSKTILFSSLGGRNFDDSPRALYEEICKRKEFDDWTLIWAFVNPEEYEIDRGIKVKIDTPQFFKILLSANVWVSNSGMDRGIAFERKGIVKIETWHGTPLKKICGEENQNSIGGGAEYKRKYVDKQTIRCAQSEYDRKIFSRIFNANIESILLCDLPRNDKLLKYNEEDINNIKEKLGIDNRKVILYTPTYREYLIDENHDTYIAPPMDLDKWEKVLGKDYILLVRAHYAVTSAMNLNENNFVKDVSHYGSLNDLYAISDIMISDYSSTFIDYSILKRPMLCFAYDLEEYEEKRGLYLDLAKTLPCAIDTTEDEVLDHIININYDAAVASAKKFNNKFAPYAGNASCVVIDKLIDVLNL